MPSAFADDLCAPGLRPEPSELDASASADDTPALDIRLTKVDESRAAEARLAVEQAQNIFENGVSAVVLELGERFHSVQPIDDRGSTFYSVRPLGPDLQTPARVRILESVYTGGLSAVVTTKHKNLKALIERVPLQYFGKAVAFRFNDRSTGRDFFLLFKDSREGGKATREIYDLVYARPYLISTRVRTKIMTRHSVSLAELDETFRNWDGHLHPGIFLNRFGEISLRPIDPSTGDKLGFFLSTDGSGETVLVAVALKPGSKLPRILSAYRPDDVSLTAVYGLMLTPEFQKLDSGS